MSSFLLFHKIVISSAGSGSSGGLASAFGFGLPLTLSNNVYSLGLVLDVDVSITMAEGAATRFVISVIDLPDRDTATLRSALAAGPLTVEVQLGYFDHPSMVLGGHPVLRGRITEVKSDVGEDGHTTVTLNGLDETGWLLLHTRARASVAGSGTLDALAGRLLDLVDPKPEGGLALDRRSSFGTSTTDFSVHDESVLAALSRLAAATGKALVVGSGTVLVGPAVGADQAPVAFDPGTNIVRLGDAQSESTGGGSGASGDSGSDDGSGSSSDRGSDRSVESTKKLAVLGHPGLRAGQRVTITGLTGLPTRPLRIRQVKHDYDHAKGYVCEIDLTDAATGAPAAATGGAAAVVDEWNRQAENARQTHPNVDIGEVTGYTAGAGDHPHRASLHYGQAPADSVATPSTDTPVAQTDTLANRAVMAPFAFDKVGLMLPVYPGMRAVLLHNRALTNDALVAGYLWPTQPASTPPPNQAGDYWLALPTGLDGQGKPTGKGVHDLVDAHGYRVVHTRGLHLVVGTDALTDVGTRPSPPTDDTCTIEHSSGTTITIGADGAVSITTHGKAITLGNGSVSLKVDGSSVAVS